MKNKGVLAVLILLILGLSFLLLKENEAKMAALAQLKDTRFKATSVINEKGNAINELETQLAELEARSQAALENHAKEMADKKEEIEKLNADFEQKTGQYEEAIGQKNESILDLERRLKESAERFDATLKKKNADLSEIGEELRKNTERLAKLLKKQELLESDNSAQRTRIEGLEKEVQALKTDKARLEAQVKAAQDKPLVLD